jgi:hypothetical protein
MKKLIFAICFVALPLWLSAGLTQAQPGQTAGTGSKERSAQYQALDQELKMLRDGIAVKEAELARLHHKWTVNKGRTPPADEVKAFEAKRAKGPVKVEDNPYINKNPLSSPGRWRAAYYEKLADVNKDKERANSLEKELDALKQ